MIVKQGATEYIWKVVDAVTTTVVGTPDTSDPGILLLPTEALGAKAKRSIGKKELANRAAPRCADYNGNSQQIRNRLVVQTIQLTSSLMSNLDPGQHNTMVADRPMVSTLCQTLHLDLAATVMISALTTQNVVFSRAVMINFILA